MTSKIVVNNIEADAGVSTVTFNSNVQRGSSNLHSTGLALGAGSTVGAVTGVTTYYGDGSQLTGIDATKIITGNTSVETSDTGSDGLVKVLVDGSEKVRINNQGQIGINTTSPDTFIHVGSATTNTHFLKFEADMGAETNRVLNIFGPDTANSTAPFTFQTGNGYLFKCDAEHSFEIDANRIVKVNNGFGSLAPIYGIRAWIAFKAAGGSNTVRGSGNATITDHGTGDFTMNFTTAMPDTGYSAVGTAGYNSGQIVLGLTGSGTESAPTTSGFRFSIRANYNNSTLMDEEYINLMVVR